MTNVFKSFSVYFGSFKKVYFLTDCKTETFRKILFVGQDLNRRQEGVRREEGDRESEKNFSGNVPKVRQRQIDDDRHEEAEAGGDHGHRVDHLPFGTRFVLHILITKNAI